MKKILILLCMLFSLSYASTPFTLSEINELHVVIENSSKLVNDKTQLRLKQMILDKLKSLDVVTDTYPQESLVLIIEEREFGKMKFLQAKLMIVSEVKRAKAKESSFGITYMMEDLFDTTEPNVDMIESLEYMLDMFEEQFIEEKDI